MAIAARAPCGAVGSGRRAARARPGCAARGGGGGRGEARGGRRGHGSRGQPSAAPRSGSPRELGGPGRRCRQVVEFPAAGWSVPALARGVQPPWVFCAGTHAGGRVVGLRSSSPARQAVPVGPEPRALAAAPLGPAAQRCSRWRPRCSPLIAGVSLARCSLNSRPGKVTRRRDCAELQVRPAGHGLPGRRGRAEAPCTRGLSPVPPASERGFTFNCEPGEVLRDPLSSLVPLSSSLLLLLEETL